MCADPAHQGFAGLAPIGMVCVPDNKNINMGGTPGTARAFKMCLCEHEEDNARYGRVSKNCNRISYL